MKPEPRETKKNLNQDLKTFEKLPAITRELLLLGNESEKATGGVRSDVDDRIKAQSMLEKQ